MGGTGGRLHTLDLAWLELEGSGPPIAIGTVAVAEGPVPDDSEVLAHLADRLPRMTALHQEVDRRGPGMRRPEWHPSGIPDLPGHLHRIRAPRGTGRGGGLDGAVSRIMEHHLPPGRPLWDAWVVEDLPHRRWALTWRVHHTIADGVGALLLLGHGFDVSSEPGGPTMADAVLGSIPRPRTASTSTAPAQSALGHILGAVRSAAPHVPAALESLVPHAPSSLTAPVGEGRTWASAEIALPQVKAAGRAFGATVNDVVLAAVAGGFRDLLEHRGEATSGRVVRNLVPVSMRAAGDDESGNHISALLGHLPVGVADPVERLRAVRAEVDHGRSAGEPALGSLLLGMADRAVPSVLQDVVVSTVGRTLPAWFFDTLTTNVPGPQFPVHLLGRRVTGMFPIIPVAGHTAITTGIFSYNGVLDIGVTGDADAAGDVDVLAGGIRRAVAELAALAG